ncbi:hypothetical protein GCM10022407_18000 [Hymenobacter antarcticus]|uniref:Secretion system C-terminal sorting domain-containing protein n=2 Tax=Hymenobacter antarcticus TaxID=486270 RepID=A0ABP7PX99_9BACT
MRTTAFLALLGGSVARPLSSQAQALYIGPNGIVGITDSVLYVRGNVMNDGRFSMVKGRLFVDEGDLLSAAGSNWTAGLGTIVLMGTASHSLSMNGATMHNLRLNNTGGTVLGSNATVKGALVLDQGHLNTTTALSMTLTPTGKVYKETNDHYVKGSLRQTQTVAGSAPIDFGRMGFVLNPQNQAFTLQVDRRTGVNQPNYSFGQNPLLSGNQGIDRMWVLSTSNRLNPATPVTVTLSWLSDNDRTLNFGASMAQVWRSTNQGLSWVREGGPQSGVARALTITPTVLNAWFTVSTADTPLPVELTDFTATARQLDAVLKWSTASELHSAWFAVERSWTGLDWREISRIPAAGTSSKPLSYSATDVQVGAQHAEVYYRLHQIDLDGTSAYSMLRSVQFAKTIAFGVVAYPVPMQEFLTLDLSTPSAGPVAIEFYDATGRLVLSQNSSALSGTTRYQMDVKSLASGIYSLRVRQGANEVRRKLQRL